jgi:hypothetical protein
MKRVSLTVIVTFLMASCLMGQSARRNYWGAGIELQATQIRTDTASAIAGGLALAYSGAIYQQKDFGFHIDLRPKLLFDQSANVVIGGSATLELRVFGMSEDHPVGLKYGWGYHFMNYSAGDKPGFDLNGYNYNKLGIIFPSTDLINELGFIVYHYHGQLAVGVSIIAINLFNQK